VQFVFALLKTLLLSLRGLQSRPWQSKFLSIEIASLRSQ
jgi:hypothetical protein